MSYFSTLNVVDPSGNIVPLAGIDQGDGTSLLRMQVEGTIGMSGYSGYSGTGFSGYSGYSGAGFSGYSGYSGDSTSGYSGYSGAQFVGSSGYSGYSGLNGEASSSGYSGHSGYSGYSGYSGFSGYSGYSGYSGISGYSGYSGYSGESGYSGYSGVSGYSGSKSTHWNASDSVSTTTSSTFASKLTLVFTPSTAGDYDICWSCELTNSATNKATEIQLILDTTNTFNGPLGGYPSSSTEYWTEAANYRTNLTAASHTIDMQFACTGGTGSIRNARILAVRV